MDMKELLEPVYPDEEPRKAWPVVLGGVATVVVLVIGVMILFGGSDETTPTASAPSPSTSIAEDGSVVETAETTQSTVTTTTLDPDATTPQEAIAAAEQFIEIEEDPEALTEFFSEIDRFIFFISVLRNPEEIARYLQRHTPNQENYVIGEATPTADGTVILDVDYLYTGNPAEVTWEIEVTDGKVTLFIVDGRG